MYTPVHSLIEDKNPKKYDSNPTSAAASSSSPPHYYSPTSIVDVERCCSLRPLSTIVEESREEKKVVPCVPTLLLDPSEEGARRFVFSLLLGGGVWPMPSTLSPRP